MSHGDGRGDFDADAAGYEEACMRGLRASGEDTAYFAQGRVDHLRAWWSDARREPPGRILDYGCGVGLATPMLARAFPSAEVVGVDPAPASIERAAAERSEVRVTYRRLREGMDLGTFDLVYVNGVVHHVVPAERPAFFAELSRALPARGIAAVYENNPANPGTRWVMSRIPFDRDAVPVWPAALRRGLGAAGIRTLRTDFLFYFPAAFAFLRPLEPMLKRVPLGAQYGVIAEAIAGGPSGVAPEPADPPSR